ncbi:nuclear transport factor 2 family protein [Streptomyces sp. SCA3-4]|uniref:nuclear transport factor 2 family protein n=1 Tax=Streptomyces sichuanensis TaxID=2871810 RepID=UPI001CE3B46B|nr:nuclear transport factor 2 family protein [Streptomyces sichuanensis]MCA6092400.1 nuclear transport factor 2 family protein [Streptomyces sichuanensis]
MPQHPNVEAAVRYHEAVSRGATGEELARFFHEEAVQEEFPNALFPDGVRRRLPDVLRAAERGREVVAHQRFEVHNAVAAGDQVALEVTWTGTLAVPLGGLPAGHVLRARIAVFLEFRDGKIWAQRNYDCYERLTDRPAGTV